MNVSNANSELREYEKAKSDYNRAVKYYNKHEELLDNKCFYLNRSSTVNEIMKWLGQIIVESNYTKKVVDEYCAKNKLKMSFDPTYRKTVYMGRAIIESSSTLIRETLRKIGEPDPVLQGVLKDVIGNVNSLTCNNNLLSYHINHSDN